MKIPTKHSISHYSSPSAWLRDALIRRWQAIPGTFVRPLETSRSFLFVAGCGHSGTTLTAARLGNHSQVLLIGRETGAFLPATGALCAKRIAAQWEYFAELQGRSFILEKTPKHIHAIRRIKKVVPEARIIVTVRNPLDNVASLFERFGDLQGAIRRWKADNREALRVMTRPDVLIVRFENLTANPSTEFRRICDFSGLCWEDGILEARSSAYDVENQDQNMRRRARQVSDPIQSNVGGWRKLISPNQARRITSATKRIAVQLGYENAISTD